MTEPKPPVRPTVAAPGGELPERPLVADASITYVTVVNPDRRRHQLQGWERDLLFSIAAKDKVGIEGVGIKATVEAFERAGLVTVTHPKGFMYAAITADGKVAAAKGWYEL